MMHVGFIGLGRMGWLMAANLAKAGIPLSVWNRSISKCMALVDAYPDVNIAESPAHIGRDCDLVFTMLADDEAVKAVYSDVTTGLVASAPLRTKHWIEMSTISPALSETLFALSAQQGVTYIDAPVSGSLNAAEAGELVFMVGASSELAPELTLCLSLMGKSLFRMGKAGSGHAAKLLINSVIHSQNQIVGEILTLASACQIDRASLMTLLGDSAAGSPMIRFRTPLYLGESDEVTFALSLAKKDMMLAQALAQNAGCSLAQIDTNLSQLQAAEDGGFGGKDMAAIASFIAKSQTKTQ